MSNYQSILVDRDEHVGIVTLNRPNELNALNFQLVSELANALEEFDRDEEIRCMVITGAGEKSFAAGADIKEMSDKSPIQMMLGGFEAWERVRRIHTPMIAAVGGYALGGGCELAMHCDMIVASENARFGQPEIKLGIIPGAGGTQRLPRAVGKAKAMDLVLTGRMMDAAEAERAGLVSRVVAADKLLEEALAAAAQIAEFSLPSVMMAKEAVNRAYESPLAEGMLFERRVFHALFATEDQKEGMAAFVEKRKPKFRHR